MQIGQSSDADPTSGPKTGNRTFPGQVVLVLQGGGALGSYQAGVYEALHEAGVEPDWIVGTSIGAINASLIAGNRVACERKVGGRIGDYPPAIVVFKREGGRGRGFGIKN